MIRQTLDRYAATSVHRMQLSFSVKMLRSVKWTCKQIFEKERKRDYLGVRTCETKETKYFDSLQNKNFVGFSHRRKP